MRTEEEIRKALEECDKVSGYAMSDGPCPRNTNGRKGCCAECSFPSAIAWVLGEEKKGSENGQANLISAIKGTA